MLGSATEMSGFRHDCSIAEPVLKDTAPSSKHPQTSCHRQRCGLDISSRPGASPRFVWGHTTRRVGEDFLSGGSQVGVGVNLLALAKWVQGYVSVIRFS